ncbi:protein PML-like [Phoenicopterus ruber ruber]
MAAPGPRLPEDDFQFILCEGCRQESPNLKLLTCLHTLCLGCLSKNKPIEQCPMCRTAIPQPSGIPDVDNLLFTNMQARLKVYKKIVDGVDLFCNNCKRASEFWCSKCEEFLCTKCFEAHQRYLKRESHEAKRVMDIRAGSAKDFLKDARRSGNLFCSNPDHKNETVSIYCRRCEKALCCSCALLDSQHAPFRDIRSETQRRQEELGAMSRELEHKRSGFEAAYAELQDEAARLERAQRETRELIRQRVEELVRLIRQEEEELLGLVEARQEQGRRELARELERVEGVLRRMEASERLVEKMSLYATEQEVMDMQPFIKRSLEELQQLQPAAAEDQAQPGDLAECRARLQALVERVTGRPGTSAPQHDSPSEDETTLILDLEPPGEHCQPHGGLSAGLPAHRQPRAPMSDPSGSRGHVCPDQGRDTCPTPPTPPALLMQRDEEAEEDSGSARRDAAPLPRSIQDSLASLQEDFSGWARSNMQQAGKLLKIGHRLLQAQLRANRHLVSVTQEIQAVSHSLATIASGLTPSLLPAASPRDPATADVEWPSLPSDMLELFPLSSPQKQEPLLSPSTSAKKKKVQNANILMPLMKALKVEDNDDGWNQTVPQQPSCLDQPGTSWAVSPMTLAEENSLLEDVPDGNDGLRDSDSDILHVESCEEDSIDEESMDFSLLDDLNNILGGGSTGEDCVGLPISRRRTLDDRQGHLVFFDVKILKNESIQMTVVDGEKIFPVVIQPMKYLSSLMAQNRVYEIGLRNLLCHLSTVHRPVLGGFDLWSLPFPTLLNALAIMNKKEEFSSVVYGFLDILPLIKEKIPNVDNYKLKNLASTYLWWHFSDCSAMENANIMKYLCEVLDVNLAMQPRLIRSQASLEAFISLQPLVDEKLLTKPSVQTLAIHSVGLSELWSCYQRNPEKGLQNMCYLINARRHSSEKKVRNLSKVKVYFQHHKELFESQKTPAGSNFPRAVQTEEK